MSPFLLKALTTSKTFSLGVVRTLISFVRPRSSIESKPVVGETEQSLSTPPSAYRSASVKEMTLLTFLAFVMIFAVFCIGFAAGVVFGIADSFNTIFGSISKWR